MASVLCILSSKGDILVWERYRNDVSKETLDEFVHQLLKSATGSLSPALEKDGVYCYHIKREKLFLLMVSKMRLLLFEAVEFLEKFYCLLSDFCGTVTEEAICKNQVLVFELMTEVIDFGHVITTSVNQLQHLVYSDPVITRPPPEKTATRKPGPFGLEKPAVSASASARPLVKSRSHQDIRTNEIYVDIVERLMVHTNSDGSISSFQVNGSMQLKSFISSNPAIIIGLNEGLLLMDSSKDQTSYTTGVYLDQCNFHECVNKENFEKNGVITIHPPQGNICVMKYQLGTTVPSIMPFHLISVVEEPTTGKDLDLFLKLQCSITGSAEALSITVHIPVPSATKSFMQQFSLTGNTAEFLTEDRKIVWKIKKMLGNTEAVAKFKLVDALQCEASRLQLGPIAVEFEISNYVISGLNVRFLRIDNRNQEQTQISRWVRYATVSDSYIFKI